MGYSIYLDSQQDFKCKLNLEGSSVSRALPRLVVNSPALPFALLFEGTILPNTNQCVIPISKLRNFLETGDKGTLQLEVIAEGDVFFKAWTDEFEAKIKNKVTVTEVVEAQSESSIVSQTKPNLMVEVEQSDEYSDLANLLKNELVTNKINLTNITTKKGTLTRVVESFVNANSSKLQSIDIEQVIDRAIKLLK